MKIIDMASFLCKVHEFSEDVNFSINKTQTRWYYNLPQLSPYRHFVCMFHCYELRFVIVQSQERIIELFVIIWINITDWLVIALIMFKTCIGSLYRYLFYISN